MSAYDLFSHYLLSLNMMVTRENRFLTTVVFLHTPTRLLRDDLVGRLGTNRRVCFCSSLRPILPLKFCGFMKYMLRMDPIPVGFSGFLSEQVDPVGITYQWGSQTWCPLYGDFHRLVEEETSVLEDVTSHMCGC